MLLSSAIVKARGGELGCFVRFVCACLCDTIPLLTAAAASASATSAPTKAASSTTSRRAAAAAATLVPAGSNWFVVD